MKRKIKIILPSKAPELGEICREFEYMQKTLHTHRGFDLHNEQELYRLLYRAIFVALYEGVASNEAIVSHVEYLVGFCKQFFIDIPLQSTHIRQLHLNIVPPKSQSTFVYEDKGTKQEELKRGTYRDIDTYLVDEDGHETDFLQHKNIAEAIEMIVDTYNNSSKKIKDIAKFVLDFFAIHPFMDANGKTVRVLLDVLLIKSEYYPSLYHKQYKRDKESFAKVFGSYTLSNSEKEKEKYLAEFISLLLRPVYKENYFASPFSHDRGQR